MSQTVSVTKSLPDLLLDEANNYIKKFNGDEMDESEKLKICNLYSKAAAQYKLFMKWEKCGEIYEEIAKMMSTIKKNEYYLTSMSNIFLEAGDCYKYADLVDKANSCYKNAAVLLEDAGDYEGAAEILFSR